MKKLGLLVMPLMAVSLLASCGESKPQVAEHFVTFDSKGGSHIDTLRVEDNGTISAPTEPTYTGHIFKGWYTTNPDPYPVGEPYTFADKITSDLTLYAYWQKADVTYHTFKLVGTNCSIFSDSGFSTQIEEGESAKFTVLPDAGYNSPRNEGDVEITGSNTSYENGIITISSITDDVTVTATSHHQDYVISYTGVNCKAGNQTATAAYELQTTWNGEGNDYVFNLTADTDYSLPEKISVLFNGVEGTSGTDYVYNSANRTLTLIKRANITIKIVANQDTPVVTSYTVTVKAGEDGEFPSGIAEFPLKVEPNSNLLADLSIVAKPTYEGDKLSQTFDAFTYADGNPIGSDDKVTSNDVVVKGTYRNKTLEECSWKEISDISAEGVDFAKTFFGESTPTDPKTKTVMVNGQPHKVRIIGYGEDYTELPIGGGDPQPDKAIGITFEFADLVSDDNGYSLGTQWNDTDDTDAANYNYLDSSVRMALVGEKQDKGHILLAQKGATVWSKNPLYKNRTILSMLPYELISVLKTPSKYINIWNKNKLPEAGWDEQVVSDKLFLLSPKEMGNNSSTQYEEPNTKVYSYYNGATNSDRIKKQVKNDVYDTLPIISGESAVQARNYSGYNPRADASRGGHYWLRSPAINSSINAWHILYSGDFTSGGGSGVNSNAFVVAPAFCI